MRLHLAAAAAALFALLVAGAPARAGAREGKITRPTELYQQAREDAEVVARLPKKASVFVDERTKGPGPDGHTWFKVRDEQMRAGWVSGRALFIQSDLGPPEEVWTDDLPQGLREVYDAFAALGKGNAAALRRFLAPRVKVKLGKKAKKMPGRAVPLERWTKAFKGKLRDVGYEFKKADRKTVLMTVGHTDEPLWIEATVQRKGRGYKVTALSEVVVQ